MNWILPPTFSGPHKRRKYLWDARKKIVEQEIDWKIRKRKRINEYDVCVISSLMETAAKETEAVGRKKEVCISLDMFISFARFP